MVTVTVARHGDPVGRHNRHRVRRPGCQSDPGPPDDLARARPNVERGRARTFQAVRQRVVVGVRSRDAADNCARRRIVTHRERASPGREYRRAVQHHVDRHRDPIAVRPVARDHLYRIAAPDKRYAGSRQKLPTGGGRPDVKQRRVRAVQAVVHQWRARVARPSPSQAARWPSLPPRCWPRVRVALAPSENTGGLLGGAAVASIVTVDTERRVRSCRLAATDRPCTSPPTISVTPDFVQKLAVRLVDVERRRVPPF